MAVMMRRILGLDLGSHSIKAVELRQTLRGVEVGQLRALTVHEVKADDAESPPLPEQLRRFAALYRLPAEYVVAALPGDRVTTRRLSLPFGERRRLAQAIPFELEGQMPFALEDVVVDWDVVRSEASRTEVIALAAPRAEVGRRLETLREAGLEPRTLEVEGFTLANLAALFPQLGTKLYVDIGHRKTTLTLCAEGRSLAMRTVPIAGLALTQAIAEERGLVFNEAEGVKCDEGIQASAAAHFVIDRLCREIVRTLGGFESYLVGHAPLEQLSLLGGTARLHRIDELIAERVGLPVDRVTFPRTDAGSALVAGGDPLLFSNALALALRGTLRANTRMNLRRDEFAYRIDLRQIGRELTWTARLGALALLLGALVLGSSIVAQSRRADAIERQLSSLYAQAFPGQSAPANVGVAMRDAVRSARERADALGVYRGNLSALDLLSEISARVPPDLEVVFEELSIDRQVVHIRGYSKSFEGVDRLRTELAKFEPFSQIQVSEIQSDQRHGGKSFSVTISMTQKGDAG
jgi:type IV pilus assembly protein PilM